jgi:hypothetical protein
LVNAETDPAIFEAGEPPWIGYGFVFPQAEVNLGPPPSGNCQEWWTWARERQGVDADITKVRLTVIGDSDVTVVVQALRVAVVKRTEPLEGRFVVCTVGGADLVVRHLDVDLDSFAEAVVSYVEAGGDPSGRFSFQLKRGEAEAFNIEARAGHHYCEWVAELYLLVDGKRMTVAISDEGRPFRTTAASHLPPLHWTGTTWNALQL